MRSFKSWMLLLVAAAGFGSLSAQAQHTFRVYAGAAPTDYSIKFDDNAFSEYRGKTAKSDYLGTNVGFSWVLPQRIYFDVSVQRSGSATHDLWSNATLGGNPTPDQDFSHDSEVLTAGYIHVLSQGQTISAFGGLRHGKTTLNAPNGATVPVSGGTSTLTWSKDIFDSRGIFFGAAWGVPALGGSISLGGAVALMGGTWKDDAGFESDANANVGVSLNGSYTYRFGQAWGVTADVRFQSYGYNFTRPSPVGDVDYNVNERIVSVGARVSYQF